jgi:hypothetical protein
MEESLKREGRRRPLRLASGRPGRLQYEGPEYTRGSMLINTVGELKSAVVVLSHTREESIPPQGLERVESWKKGTGTECNNRGRLSQGSMESEYIR